MREEQHEALVEAALHAQVCSRCHRSYGHELRNGLQGLYGGFDAVVRAAQNKVPTSIPFDKGVQFVRQALTGHEQALDRMLHWLAPVDNDPAAVDAGNLLSGLAKFLSSDAARHNVRLLLSIEENAVFRAQPGRTRLACLSLLVDSVDELTAGGEVHLLARTQDGQVEIAIADTRKQAVPADPWVLDFNRPSLREAIGMHVVRRIVLSQGGRIECTPRDTGGRTVRLAFPLQL